MEVEKGTPTIIRPKKHSLNRNFLDIGDNEEIEAEIKRRQEEAINKSSEVRRKSTAAPLIAGFSASELNQHCKDCIKLSTENKINTKNAFSFLLIDVMAAMAKKADSEINKNFQVASCTLDASVKIYGYRVDAVHTEAVKMAGGVLSKEVANNEENVENLEVENVENQFKAKLRKKKRKRHIVVHPDTLNAKSESDILMDVIPHQSFLMHKTDGNDLLIKIPKYDDNCELYINSEYICWPYDKQANDIRSFKRGDCSDASCLKSLFREIDISKNDHLCPLYQNMEFGKECDETVGNVSDEDLPWTDKNAFEFDLNATVDDVPVDDEPEVPTQRNRLQVPLGGYESDQEIELLPVPQLKAVQNLQLADLKSRITLNHLEYSMFDEQVLKGWAGPSYWKVGPTKQFYVEGKENDNAAKAPGLKSTRKVKQKPTAGLYDIDENVLVKHLACGDKTTLNKSTMLNWSPENVTVPKDCMYKTINLLRLYHFPNFFVKLKDRTESSQVEIAEANDSKSESDEELEYCSNVSMQYDCVADGKKEEEEEEEEEENCQVFEKEEIWDEKNMVALPNKVEKIPMSTFVRKKNVDIKYLKKCLWNMLTESSEKKTDTIRINEPITFSEVMKTCSVKMQKNLASSLSAPQIFNALLHLTNEKCLILTQDKLDKSDFVVFQ